MISDIVIMAGGFGERLWPASSPEFPKQFMTVNGSLSFLQESLKRAFSQNVPGKIIIVTRKDIEKECVSQCVHLAETLDSPELLEKIVVLAEPSPKHTSAACMSACAFIKLTESPSKKEHQNTVLVLTSDHVIFPTDVFISDCENAAKAAENNHFVCFAIPPSEPATGYGYIKTGNPLFDSGEEANVFEIENFKEKPDLKTAQAYLSEGNYKWNSGMFAFDCDFFIEQMKELTNDVYKSFEPVLKGNPPAMKTMRGVLVLEKWQELEEAYKSVPPIAVDKSIAEKTKSAAAVKAHFNWTDVGSWDTFASLCESGKNESEIDSNQENNFSKKKVPVAEAESKRNFVYSDIPVALCGVEDLIVVIKNGKALIMKKGNSALTRKAAEQIEQSKAELS